MSLTSELDDPAQPDLPLPARAHPERARPPTPLPRADGRAAPLVPNNAATVAYATLGGAFDWQLRFLLTPAPDLHLAGVQIERVEQAPDRL